MGWVVIHHCNILPCHCIEKDGFESQEDAQEWADFMMKNRGIRNVGKLGNDGKCCIYYIEYLEAKSMIREVYEKLCCGDINAYPPALDMSKWSVVHACKDPMHRNVVGYTGRGCPKDNPEYLWAERGNRLALNIVDAPSSLFFDKSMIDKALEFIEQKLSEGLKVLVHCNQGESRSASICLLYLIKHGIIKGETFEDCEAEFMKLYPEYNPGAGMRGFVKEHWKEYLK